MQRCLDRALDKQLGRHAMAGLAVALVECAADAQTARNSLFPEARDSPVIGYLLMACSMALDHFLLLPGNPGLKEKHSPRRERCSWTCGGPHG